MKDHALFPLKDKSKSLKCRLPQFLFGAIRVNMIKESGPHLHAVNNSIHTCTDHILPKVVMLCRIQLNLNF